MRFISFGRGKLHPRTCHGRGDDPRACKRAEEVASLLGRHLPSFPYRTVPNRGDTSINLGAMPKSATALKLRLGHSRGSERVPSAAQSCHCASSFANWASRAVSSGESSEFPLRRRWWRIIRQIPKTTTAKGVAHKAKLPQDVLGLSSTNSPYRETR